MNTFLEKIVDNTLSFFFEKGAETFFSKIKQNIENHNLKKEIQKYSEQYFKDCFIIFQ